MKKTTLALSKSLPNRLHPVLTLGLVVISLSFLSLKSAPFVFAACEPYPECHPDLNLMVRGYEPISGAHNLIEFYHETDPKRPLLSTLLEGEARPAINSLYQVYDWDWDTNTKDGLIPKPDDEGLKNFDFATLIGLKTQAGQGVLVPNSGYDIGGGMEAMVLYATATSITLHYGREDSVAIGYAIHLENFRVDPALLNLYNQLNAAGRTELPALAAGAKIGEATGSEILVAIRDGGTFMDPRWIEWWGLDPADALELLLRSLTVASPLPEFCYPGTVEDNSSRPAPCDACNQTGDLEYACTTAFKVSTTLEYQRKDSDDLCGEQHWIDRIWTGTVRINPSEVEVPFAGKKLGEDEEKYLATYFEGTNEIYDYKTVNYHYYWKDWIDHAGVFRKLTPMEYQDQLKKELVQRAFDTDGTIREEAIHNYKVQYAGRVCWDLPVAWAVFSTLLNRFGLTGFPVVGQVVEYITDKAYYCEYGTRADIVEPILANFNGLIDWNPLIPPHLKNALKIAYRRTAGKEARLKDLVLPPDQKSPTYVEEWDAWNRRDKDAPHHFRGKWATLWSATPMFSREDTFDEIIPYAGLRPIAEDTFTITQTDRPEFPHLARLYEAAEAVQKLFIPAQGGVLAQNSQGAIIAQGCELPRRADVNLCQWPALTDSNPNDPICCDEIVAQLTARDKFINYCYEECVYGEICGSDPVCTAPDCPDYVFAANRTSQNYTLASQPASQNQTLAASYLAQTEGDICNYCEHCNGVTGRRQCTGTIQDGTCKFKWGIDPACTPCSTCHDGVCEVCEEPGPPPACEEACAPECIPHWGLLTPCCLKEETQPVSRMIGIDLQIPYVGGIWEKTAGLPLGIFNIFRVYEQENFPEMPAASDKPVRYYFTSSENGTAEPTQGQFYFPYLGGVQIGKNWVVRTIWPFK